jgi:hypothetical protein
MMKRRGIAPAYRTLLRACALFFIASAIAHPPNAHAQNERIPVMIEIFTLTDADPRREFYGGKLIIELVSSTSDGTFKKVTVRISSKAHETEFRETWQEHTFIKQLKYYAGDPVSGSPFKCMEGWFYYINSAPGSATISLHAGPEPVGSFWHEFDVISVKYFQYFIMAIGWIVVAVLLYHLVPFAWSFITIQRLARAHALKTGFETYPLPVYLAKRIPLLICICLVMYGIFSFDWKYIAGALTMAVFLQIYFNRHNRRQLEVYAEKTGMKPFGKSKKYAFTGKVKGMRVTLGVNGIFLLDPSFKDDLKISPAHIHISFLVLQVSLKTDGLNGLTFSRDRKKPYGWVFPRKDEIINAAVGPLAALSSIPRYCLNSIEVNDSTLTAIKSFAPDTPAEIHLITDLVVDLAAGLSTIRSKK